MFDSFYYLVSSVSSLLLWICHLPDITYHTTIEFSIVLVQFWVMV